MPWIWIVLVVWHLLSLTALALYEGYTLWIRGDEHEPLTHWVRDVLFELGFLGTIAMIIFAVYWSGLVAFALWLGPHWLVDRPFARDKRVEVPPTPNPTRRITVSHGE